jgi:hypothetical protein
MVTELLLILVDKRCPLRGYSTCRACTVVSCLWCAHTDTNKSTPTHTHKCPLSLSLLFLSLSFSSLFISPSLSLSLFLAFVPHLLPISLHSHTHTLTHTHTHTHTGAQARGWCERRGFARRQKIPKSGENMIFFCAVFLSCQMHCFLIPFTVFSFLIH